MTPEVKEIISQAIVGLFSIVILPTIPLVYRFVKAFVEARIERIQDQVVKAGVEFAFQRLDYIVSNTVAAISQVNKKNTGLTKEEADSRKEKAFSFIKSQLTDADSAILESAVKDFDKYLKVKIEATRFFQKNEICKQGAANESRLSKPIGS